jgi:N-methylhydantoinase B
MSLNDGMVEGLGEVALRDGSILSPRLPAPLAMRGGTWIGTNNAVLGTLAASGLQTPAGSAAYVVYHVSGYHRDGGYVLFSDGLAVGYGAKPWADGLDAVYFLAQENMPVEFAESQWPVRILAYGYHRDSGGPGLYRGGAGVIRRLEVLQDGLSFSAHLSNIHNPPWGADGGGSGRPGSVRLHSVAGDFRNLRPISSDVHLSRGDVVEVRTSGGGGYGDPYLRDPALVLEDVTVGVVSLEGALNDYGVVLDPDTLKINLDRTHEMRLTRGPIRPSAGPRHEVESS